MSKTKDPNDASNGGQRNRVSSSVEELQLAAMERGDDSFQTGRYLITYKEGAGEEALNLSKHKESGLQMQEILKVRRLPWKVLVMRNQFSYQKLE